MLNLWLYLLRQISHLLLLETDTVQLRLKTNFNTVPNTITPSSTLSKEYISLLVSIDHIDFIVLFVKKSNKYCIFLIIIQIVLLSSLLSPLLSFFTFLSLSFHSFFLPLYLSFISFIYFFYFLSVCLFFFLPFFPSSLFFL